jgi:hypothetical protein
VILPMSKVSYPDLDEVRRQSLNCLGSLCSKPIESFSEEYLKIYEILFENLEFYGKSMKDFKVNFFILTQKFMTSILRSLNFVIQSKKLQIQNVHDLVKILLKVMSHAKSMENQEHLIYSDSDSDSENAHKFISKNRENIRLNVLQIISSLAKLDFKSIFGEWKYLIPESSALKLNTGSETLVSVMLFDSSVKCRTSATITISTLLMDSGKYLSQAEDRK